MALSDRLVVVVAGVLWEALHLFVAGVLALLNPSLGPRVGLSAFLTAALTAAAVASNFLGLASESLPDFASAATYLVAYASIPCCPSVRPSGRL